MTRGRIQNKSFRKDLAIDKQLIIAVSVRKSELEKCFRRRVSQRPPVSKSAGWPEGSRGTGDFFWLLFFFAKEK
jgi:hypothetical protein